MLKTVRCTQVLKKPLVIYLIIIFVTNCFAIASPFIRPFLYSIQMIDICVRLGEMNHNDPADIGHIDLHIWPANMALHGIRRSSLSDCTNLQLLLLMG